MTLQSIKWFFVGVFEFRRGVTTNPGEYIEAYEWGREIAHRLTLRAFEGA